ncbi:hypothetical protein, partial [Micromonospora arborensis]|uniref:hypothetical protein n=1 Tax=Micromonospora arborensis TaxID=2116518 RepID=UPI0011B67068
GTLSRGPRHPSPPAARAATVLATRALPRAPLAGPTGGAARRDLVRMRPSTRRLTVELFVLGLAVLAAVLLRRRGLTLGEVDP